MNKDLISRSKLIETIIDPLNVNDAAKNDWYEGYYDAKNEDVEIIKSQPAVELQSDDVISRSALREEITSYDREFAPDWVLNAINNAPAVEKSEIWEGGFADGLAVGAKWSERPQGKWIDHSMENILWGHNECPFCHKRSNRGAHFCQYCGAALEDSEV